MPSRCAQEKLYLVTINTCFFIKMHIHFWDTLQHIWIKTLRQHNSHLTKSRFWCLLPGTMQSCVVFLWRVCMFQVQKCEASENKIRSLFHYLTNLMHKICFTISFISCLYMFWAHVLIIRRSKLHYTASGIITPIGVLEHVEALNKTYCEINFVHQVG